MVAPWEYSLPHRPSIIAKAAAPVARVWQHTQDGIARLLGFRSAGNASAIVGVVGLTTMAVAGILGPAAYSVGLTVAGVGGAGLVENHITKRIAKMDGKS